MEVLEKPEQVFERLFESVEQDISKQEEECNGVVEPTHPDKNLNLASSEQYLNEGRLSPIETEGDKPSYEFPTDGVLGEEF